MTKREEELGRMNTMVLTLIKTNERRFTHEQMAELWVRNKSAMFASEQRDFEKAWWEVADTLKYVKKIVNELDGTEGGWCGNER